MKIKVPVNTCPGMGACRDMGDVRLIPTADALCGSRAFQHNFQPFVAQRWPLCRKSPVSRESPERNSLPVAVIPQSHWLTLNTPKSFGVPTAKLQRNEVRRLCRPVDWASASYPLFAESLVQVLSNNAEETRWCPIAHEPHALWLMMFQEFW
jgi:hypothetical protein